MKEMCSAQQKLEIVVFTLTPDPVSSTFVIKIVMTINE